jgi:tetratricopeptide (TPR) repeat protein
MFIGTSIVAIKFPIWSLLFYGLLAIIYTLSKIYTYRYDKGIGLIEQIKYQEAIEAFDKVILRNPNYHKAYNNKGLALIRLGKYQEALDTCDKGISINPNLAELYINKGIALINLGEYQEAIENCDKAISLKPDLALAYYNKGIGLAFLGKKDKALEVLHQGNIRGCRVGEG